MKDKKKFECDLGVVGLGYVGLPLAVEAANNKLKVLGYDIGQEKSFEELFLKPPE